MALRNLIVGHLRNISTKLFENQPDTFVGEDFFSFPYSHIRQNSPAPWMPCFLANQHGLKESDKRVIQETFLQKLIENLPTSNFKVFCFVAMETRILHGSQKFEGILVRSLRGCFLWSFIPNDQLVTEELTDNGCRTKGNHNNSPLALRA